MARKGQSGMRGANELIRNLYAEARKRKVLSKAGLIAAATFIRQDMDRVPPLIPVDTNELRSSWFITPGQINNHPFVQMGFTAPYAVIVHEDMRKKNWKRAGAGPKFFESALRRNYAKILLMLALEMKKGKSPSAKTRKKRK